MSQQFPTPPPPQYLPPAAYPPAHAPITPRRREPQHSPVVAPLLALVGLLLIGIVSVAGFAVLGLDLGGSAATAPGTTPSEASVAVASSAPGATPTPAPPVARPTVAPIVIVAPPGERADIKGTILFSRGGDIWSASGQELRKLSDSNSDSAPTWTSNGKQIYFTRVNRRTTKNGRPGGLYTLYVPDIWRMDADGSNKKRVYSALLRGGSGLWFSHVWEPDISPDGKTLAVVSDGPNGNGSAVVLHMLSSKPNGRLNPVQAKSWGDLGHNDPEWSPDGRKLAYTRNRNTGTTGVPTVGIFTCKSRRNCTDGKNRLLKPGYANPSWSPDGTWLAVESTRGQGRNIAIVNVKKGDPRVVLTRDGNSFAPVVSPDGDQIAYLHRDGLKIDLRVMTLDIADDGKISLIDDRAVTSDGAIDAASTPAWHIPKSRLTPRSDPAVVTDAATAAVEEPLVAQGS